MNICPDLYLYLAHKSLALFLSLSHLMLMRLLLKSCAILTFSTRVENAK